MRRYILALSVFLIPACSGAGSKPGLETPKSISYETVGSIETSRPDIIEPSTKIEKLGGNFGWSEGPVWVEALDALLFTDVPGNTMWKFQDGGGITEFLTPSGAVPPIRNYTSSPGANGLIMLDDDHVLVPDHGNRRLYKLNVHTKSKTLVADKFGDKRFNSPNDAVLDSEDGSIYFTDPPYGLKDQDDNPAKELEYNGVYILRRDGYLALITDDLTRPNGIILSPDEQTLYVANSDPEAALWMAYEKTDGGFIKENGRLLLDVTEDVKAGLPGLPDGMAMGEDGTIFATGPGGVLIISPEGERLGLISTGTAIANVTFGGPEGRDLYMTSNDFLARARTEIKGYGF